MKQWLSKYPFGIGIAFVFIISRILYNMAGVFYDASMYNRAWQLLDVELLKHQLLESLWYMHSQPPLFNLFCGIILKISGPYFPEVFHFAFLSIGLLSALMMFDIMNRLGVYKTISFLLTLIYMCSPTIILYENWLFYSYLEPFLLLIIIWGAACYFKNGKQNKHLWVIFIGTCAICLTRSLFHIGFFVILIGLIFIFSNKRKQVLAVSVVPFLLTFFWYLKNLLLFGSFSASSWFGMNFARMAYDDTTPIGKIGLWQNPNQYYDAVKFQESPYPVQALTRKHKENGSCNFNYYGYIAISEQFKKETFAALKKDSKKYTNTVYYVTRIFFEPSDQIRGDFLEKNRQKIMTVNRIYNFGYDSPTGFIDKNLIDINQWIYVVILFSALLVCLSQRKDIASPQIISLIIFISLYTFTAGVLFEVGENNRFRFPTISLFFLLVGLIINHLIRVIKKRALSKKNKILNKQ